MPAVNAYMCKEGVSGAESEWSKEEHGMTESTASTGQIIETTLQEFFHDSLHGALSRQQVDAQPETASYLVNLLVSFLRTERLYEPNEDGAEFRPLALRYGDTLKSLRPEWRARALRNLGDVALFVAGVFAESFNRKLVDVDYYACMGGVAYARLADSLRASTSGRPFSGLFEELAAKFTDFADVLGEVAEHPEVRHHQDVLRLYERWLKTGSRRAAARLRALGIEPNATLSRVSH
jgi:hypothetical protein